MFYGLYVGLAKLHHGATPPSVMVLFGQTHLPLLTIIRVDDQGGIQVDQLEYTAFCNLDASTFHKLGADLHTQH